MPQQKSGEDGRSVSAPEAAVTRQTLPGATNKIGAEAMKVACFSTLMGSFSLGERPIKENKNNGYPFTKFGNQQIQKRKLSNFEPS